MFNVTDYLGPVCYGVMEGMGIAPLISMVNRHTTNDIGLIGHSDILPDLKGKYVGDAK